MSDTLQRIYRVNTGALNLRDYPSAGDESNVLVELPRGQAVVRMDARDHGGWWFVFADTPAEGIFLGYLSKKYLVAVDTEADPFVNQGERLQHPAPADEAGEAPDDDGPDNAPEDDGPTPLPPELVEGANEGAAAQWPEAHAEHSSLMSPDDKWGVYRLNAPDMPKRDPELDPAARADALRRIADYLDPEDSRRYARPSPNARTRCNIYAYDFADRAGAYLPRVWWEDSEIIRIESGETPRVVFRSDVKNVREMTANDLMRWFRKYSAHYGWRQVEDVGALQECANDGRVAVIVARNRNEGQSGHITMIAPEGSQDKDGRRWEAERDNGQVRCPVISQAGARNFRCGRPSPNAGRYWWEDSSRYADHGFWVHD